MEWLIGIYLVIGVITTIARMGKPAPLKPAWMLGKSNPIMVALFFALHSIFWPFAK